MVAFGRRGVADVTRRYTADFAGALARRTLVSEPFLQVRLLCPCNSMHRHEVTCLVDSTRLMLQANCGACPFLKGLSGPLC